MKITVEIEGNNKEFIINSLKKVVNAIENEGRSGGHSVLDDNSVIKYEME